MRAIRRELTVIEPLYARLLTDSMLAAWLSGGNDIAQSVADLLPRTGMPPPDSPRFRPSMPDDDLPIVEFPIIREAARSLDQRQVLRASEYYRLEAEAKAQAFTVSNVGTEAALERIQEALADDVAEGGTEAQFQRRVLKAWDSTPLAPHHLGNVYRTNVAQAYSVGQRRILDHPQVASAFPYVMWVCIRDGRVRPDHLAMETAGLNGTNVFRANDPDIRRVWAPHGWQCRCRMVAIGIEAAARRGVVEAKQWLDSGMPPVWPTFVGRVPIITPVGWE